MNMTHAEGAAAEQAHEEAELKKKANVIQQLRRNMELGQATTSFPKEIYCKLYRLCCVCVKYHRYNKFLGAGEEVCAHCRQDREDAERRRRFREYREAIEDEEFLEQCRVVVAANKGWETLREHLEAISSILQRRRMEDVYAKKLIALAIEEIRRSWSNDGAVEHCTGALLKLINVSGCRNRDLGGSGWVGNKIHEEIGFTVYRMNQYFDELAAEPTFRV